MSADEMGKVPPVTSRPTVRPDDSNNLPLPALSGPAPQIPDHELIRPIGRGSYGEVWLARNIMGAYRAVKIVYRGTFDSDKPYEREFQGIKRFEPISRSHESQLDVLHVGRGDGYFYYIMELADDQTRGQAIDPDSYFPRTLRNELNVRGRIPVADCVELALGLATALEHLHGHGLVHRDVKPSNIVFVNGTPKLADIGLVAQVDATLSFVGTEGYLPPEGPGTPQADIYSLGKVLYEMATGRDRQDYPELPTNVGAIPDSRQLMELNEIIIRACHRDTARRYPSAAEMRKDLEFLRSGNSLARLRTVERRLRTVTRAGIAAGLIALLAGGAYFGQQKRAERALAISEREAALRQSAEEALATAETEAARSAQVAQFMRDMLAGVGPSVALGRDTTMLREILDKTAERLSELETQPAVEADLRSTLGMVYAELGEYADAETMHRTALDFRRRLHGDVHPEVAESLSRLGEAFHQMARYTEAQAMHREALAMRRTLFGNEHPDVAASLHSLAESIRQPAFHDSEAESMFREALELRRRLLGSDHPSVADTLGKLGLSLWHRNAHAESEALFREALEIRRGAFGNEHPMVALSLDRLGLPLTSQKKFDEAEGVLNQALTMRQNLLGDNHPSLGYTLANLGRLRRDQGRELEAEEMLRKAIEVRRQLGREHFEYGISVSDLGASLLRQGKYEEAEELFKDQTEFLSQLGHGLWNSPNPETGRMGELLVTLAGALYGQGKFSEGAPVHNEGLEMLKLTLGAGHEVLGHALQRLGNILYQQGEYAKAEASLRQASEILGKALGHERCAANALCRLGSSLARQGRYEEGENLQRESLALYQRFFGVESLPAAKQLECIASLLTEQERHAEVEPLLRESLRIKRNALSSNDMQVSSVLASLVSNLLRQKRFAEAEGAARECLEIREAEIPDQWLTFNARSMLGAALLGQGRYDEAEHWIVSGYHGLKEREEAVPKLRIEEAFERVRQLHAATGRPEEFTAIIATSQDHSD
jgi:tetratricopeptide (TPR) repeat protein